MIPSTFRFRPVAWRARTWLLWLALAGHVGLLATEGGEAPGAAGPDLPWLVAARADDDGNGDDGGDEGGPAGAGKTSGRRSGGGGLDVDSGAVESAPLVESESFRADELVALDPPPAALQRTQRWGARVIESVPLGLLGQRLVRLRLPPGLDARTAREIAEERDPGVFDLHRLYRLDQGGPPSGCSGSDCPAQPAGQGLPDWPEDRTRCGAGQVLGLVDTEPALGAPALRGARLGVRRFLEEGRMPAEAAHGTAVAALLVGRADGGFAGLVPQARVFAAAPFFITPSGSTLADAAGLIRSLDWLVGEGVRVIGMSLSGPPSAPLGTAVQRAQARGVLFVAAAGNNGRNAPAAHPAALAGVLGATAVSGDRRAYWRAGQGDHVDFALPGVDLWLPDESGRLTARSGTSYAVPHLVALVSQSVQEARLTPADWLEGRRVPVLDLGSRGRDPVFGWGLPQPGVRCP